MASPSFRGDIRPMRLRQSAKRYSGDLTKGCITNLAPGTISLIQRIKIGLGVAMLACAAGCVGYVDGGGSAAVVVPGPVFYGGFESRPVVRVYSDRGYRSREYAHPGRWDRR